MDRIELIKLWRFKSLCKINSAVLSHCKCIGEYIYGHDKYNIDGKHLQEKMEMKSMSILGMENESLDNYVCLLSISHS